jgi:hypothetical protein
MRRTTNLHWPIEPFGATQRPFAPDRPMMAAVAVGLTGYVRRPEWACVIYLYTDSTRTLSLDGRTLNVGFEVLTSDPGDGSATLPERFDEILVAARRHAKILAGHDLATDLAAVTAFGVERRLPGVDSVRQQWTSRHAKERGTATVIDTAHDIGHPDVTDLNAVCEHAALTAATVDPPQGTPLAVTVRQAITRTLAIALLAGRAAGRYDWANPVDLDDLVAATAWDHLNHLDQKPSDATAP